MPLSLPARPNLEWLKKTAKQRLKELRALNESARLADAQLAVARDYRFDSWRKLRRHVEARELLRRGARIGLLEALLFADDALVAKLLEPGASALPAQPNAGSILNFARTTFAIDRLLDLGAPIDLPDRWGSAPIESMSRLGSRGQVLVRHLIARGASAAPQEYARLGDQRTLAAIVESDPGVARSDAVIMAAVEFRHHALVEWLLTNGANVNARSTAPSRQTALHAAAWNGDLPMVQLLVAAGADTTIRDEEHDSTPRGWAETAIHVRNNAACQAVAAYLGGVER